MAHMTDRIKRIVIQVSLLLCTLGFIVLLSERTSVSAEEDGSVIPALSQERIVLKPGQKYKLILSAPENASVAWSARNCEVAKVSKQGRVVGISEGVTYVYAKVSVPDKNDENAKPVTLKCKVVVEEEKTVTLAAVGDALIHEAILNSGKKKDGTYSYYRIFANIKNYIKPFDVKIINQETIFIEDETKYAGYPSFGTPAALGDAMRKAGFNVITCATNHAYDRGRAGILDTVNYWKQYSDKVLMTGIYSSQEEYDMLSIREYNGIKIAFLNYTTLVNSEAGREDYYIRTYNEAKAVREIKNAKKKADFVIVLPHWGVEYEHEPSVEQVKMAQQFADAGADLIIGCHPHVVQPLKIIIASDGRHVPCYYSLGNFVSNMFWMKCQLEGMAEVTIKKWNGETRVDRAEFTPLVNHINANDTIFTVYLLKDYQDDKYKRHYMNHQYWMGLVTYDRLLSLFNSIGNEKWE